MAGNSCSFSLTQTRAPWIEHTNTDVEWISTKQTDVKSLILQNYIPGDAVSDILPDRNEKRDRATRRRQRTRSGKKQVSMKRMQLCKEMEHV